MRESRRQVEYGVTGSLLVLPPFSSDAKRKTVRASKGVLTYEGYVLQVFKCTLVFFAGTGAVVVWIEQGQGAITM